MYPVVRNSELDSLQNDQINYPSYSAIVLRFLEVVEQQSTLPQLASAIDALRSSVIVATVLNDPKQTVAVSVLQQYLNSERCKNIHSRFLQRLLVVANTSIRLSNPLGGGTPTVAVNVRVNSKSVLPNRQMTTLSAYTIGESLNKALQQNVETFTMNLPMTHNQLRLPMTDTVANMIATSMRDLQDVIEYSGSTNNVQVKDFTKTITK